MSNETLWERLAMQEDEINSLRAKVEALRGMIRKHVPIVCTSLNHHSGDFHKDDEDCPVVNRIKAALSGGEEG